MDKVIYGIFAICNGTSKEWEETNPVLEKGEIGYDSSTNRLKVGDGESRWSKLDWVRGKTDINSIFAKDVGIDKINTLDANNVQNALEELMLKNNTNVESIESLKQNKTNKADEKMMVEDFSFKTNGDEIFATVNKYNAGDLTDNTSAPDKKVLPLATDTTAGAMSPSDYAQIRANKEAIERLDNDSVRLLYTEKENPTAEEIDAFVISKGYKTPYKGVAVVVDKTFNIWHFYEGGIGWHDDGIDTVIQFTNDKAGIIKGANIDGKVYAETDGTGSVKGWNAVKTDISTNTNDITNLKSNLNNHIDNKANPHGVTAEQVNTYTKEVIDEKLDNVTQPFDEPESLQASEKFLSDTEDDTYFIHTLGNTEQHISLNLFDKSKKNVLINQYRLLDGTLHETQNVSCTDMKIPVQNSTQYTLQGVGSSHENTAGLYFWDKDKNWIGKDTKPCNNVITITTPSNCAYIDIQVYNANANTQGVNWDKLQVEQGSVATPYQPYTGQPSPDNPIEVKSVVSPISVESNSINLTNDAGWSAVPYDSTTPKQKSNDYGTTINTTDANTKVIVSQSVHPNADNPISYVNGFMVYCFDKKRLKPNKNYSVSFDVKILKNPLNADQFYIFANGISGGIVRFDKNVLETQRVRGNFDYQEKYNRRYIEIRIAGCDLEISNVMVTEVSTPNTSFVPYQESTSTYSITDVNGVTHEMNGIGDVHDQLVFKGDKWYLEKKFERVDLSSLTWYLYEPTSQIYYSNTLISSAKKPKNNYTNTNIKSDAFTMAQGGQIIVNKLDDTIGFISGGSLIVRSSAYTTLEKFIAVLKNKYLVYELETPEYYELDPTEVVKMFAKTFSGGTNLSITSTKATPLIDFKNLLLVGEHDNVVIKKNGKILDVHTCSDNVGMRNGLTLEETMATIPTMEVLNRELDNKQPKGNYLTEHQDISGKADTTYVDSELDKKLDKKNFNLNFNQILQTSYYDITLNGGLVVSNFNDHFHIEGTTSNSFSVITDSFNNGFVASHKYYLSYSFVGSMPNLFVYARQVDTQYKGMPCLLDGTNIIPCRIAVGVYTQSTINADIYPMIIDLTEMFGKGNEPKTVEEVQKYVAKGVYYPYTPIKADKEYVDAELDKKQPKGNYLTEHQDISGKADTTYVDSELDKKLDKTEFNLQFNQLFKPNIYYNYNYGALVITNNNDGSISVTDNNFNNTGTNASSSIPLIQSHKYYFNSNPTENNKIVCSAYFKTSGRKVNKSITTGDSEIEILAIEFPKNVTFTNTFRPILIDLTEMFGAGNEPTTTAEVQKYISNGTYYPYTDIVNKAELTELAGKVNTNTSAIDSNIKLTVRTEPIIYDSFTGFHYIEIFETSYGANIELGKQVIPLTLGLNTIFKSEVSSGIIINNTQYDYATPLKINISGYYYIIEHTLYDKI